MSSSGTLQQSSASESSASFERFGGYAALFAALASLLYSVAFVILKNVIVYSVALAVGGIVTTATLTAIYFRVRETDAAFSLWALLLGGVAALGSAAHGIYDLATALTPGLTDSTVMTPHGSSQGLLARRLALSSQCRWDVPWYVSGLEQPCQIGPTPCQDVASSIASSIAITVKDQAAIRRQSGGNQAGLG